jgi:hypothetical protein
MRPYLYCILVLFLISSGASCRKNFQYAPSAGNLEFSKDTVFLDTIFSNIGSSTYSLKVYNTTRDDIEIPSIRLQQGQQSSYRLNVDGLAGKDFQNIPILAQDSMFIFIETTFDVKTTDQNEFLYTDKLLFDVDDDQQEVNLVTLVKDAIFLFPAKNSEGISETISLGTDQEGNEIMVEGFFLDDAELQFTNEKPYVVYGYAGVASGKTLDMAAGTRVHFHNDSGIYVQGGGKLHINGSLSTDLELLENEVIFEGDRLEPEFGNIPGQWGAILIASGSTENTIDYLTIKNATIGVLAEGDGILDSPTLTLRNSQIYNSLSANLWAKSAAVSGKNLVLGGAGSHSLYCNLGGDYSFEHCTIANYWAHGFRLGSALQIDNHLEDEATDLINAAFINCIVAGTQTREFLLNDNGTNTFNFSFTNCLLLFEKNGQFIDNPLYDFEDSNLYANSFFNQPTDFIDPFDFDFRIGEASAAKDSAQLETALLIPLDLLGIDRTTSPDIGAYELTQQD